MLREHQFLHGLAPPTLARHDFPTRFSQSGSLIKPPEPLQRNAVWGTTTTTNSSGADPKQHLKEISIQTLSQIHFKPIQLNSN